MEQCKLQQSSQFSQQQKLIIFFFHSIIEASVNQMHIFLLVFIRKYICLIKQKQLIYFYTGFQTMRLSNILIASAFLTILVTGAIVNEPEPIDKNEEQSNVQGQVEIVGNQAQQKEQRQQKKVQQNYQPDPNQIQQFGLFDGILGWFGINTQQQYEQQYQQQQQQQRQQRRQQRRDQDLSQNQTNKQQLKRNVNNFEENNARQYNPEQKNFRQNILQKNLNRINSFNSNKNSYQLGQTQFTDISPQEFKVNYLMQDPPQMPAITAPPMMAPPDFQIVPVDWRSIMGTAKHQGKCGSCYAFSVLDVIAGLIKKQRSQDLDLSYQQVVDCCKSGCNGCRGGWPVSALQYVSKNGIASAKDYPYTAKIQKCQGNVEKANYIDQENPFSQIDSVGALAYSLQTGPVSVIMDASDWDPLYKSGTFNKCNKEKTKYNHAVVCVGINKKGVWIVRNSWGKNWGDKGHIYLAPGNSCGIAVMGIIPNFIPQEQGTLQEQQTQQYNQDGIGLIMPGQ